MVETELGEVPRGWKVGTLDDICVITMGQSPPGTTYNETGEGLPFYQGITDFGFRFPSRRIYCIAPTRFGSVGKSDVHGFKVVLPPEYFRERFGSFVEPFDKHIANNEKQSQILISIRDALLPKLMSGEIRLSDDKKSQSIFHKSS
jgi:restriction endonuclease S subunit